MCRARPLWPSAKHHYICHGRPQGPHPAHVGIHALFVCLTSFCGRPLTPPSRALHPSVIHALFIRLTADVRHPHIAYGRRMKLSSRCSSVCRARPLWPSVIYIYDGVLRTAPNPTLPHPAHVGIQPLFVCLTSFYGRPLTLPSRTLQPSDTTR